MQYIYMIYITTADAWVIVERGEGHMYKPSNVFCPTHSRCSSISQQLNRLVAKALATYRYDPITRATSWH